MLLQTFSFFFFLPVVPLPAIYIYVYTYTPRLLEHDLVREGVAERLHDPAADLGPRVRVCDIYGAATGVQRFGRGQDRVHLSHVDVEWTDARSVYCDRKRAVRGDNGLYGAEVRGGDSCGRFVLFGPVFREETYDIALYPDVGRVSFFTASASVHPVSTSRIASFRASSRPTGRSR